MNRSRIRRGLTGASLRLGKERAGSVMRGVGRALISLWISRLHDKCVLGQIVTIPRRVRFGT